MLGAAMYTTIKTLWGRYKNKTKIVRATGHDWKTVAKVIKKIEAGKEYPEKKPHPRKLDGYKEKIINWIGEELSGLRIYEELRELGVEVGYSTVKFYIADIKKRENIFIRIHTKPGEEAQVDFGYVGLTFDNNGLPAMQSKAMRAGKRRKTWVFNMRLSYSRKDYYEKVYDQRVETFIRCHINAFNYFRGVPEYVKIDNLKAAILEANFYEPIYQSAYKNFAEYYGFKPIPCRVRKPNDKGKVESGIKYVKRNFFAGRKFIDGDDVDKRLRDWQEKVCNARVHGTTRRIPNEVFLAEENSKLRLLPETEFKLAEVGVRKVYHDCHIFVGYNYYSVPFEYIGKDVETELGENLLRIFYKGQEIAVHARLTKRGEFSTKESHYPKYKMQSATEYQEKYQLKMREIGSYGEQIFFFIKERKPAEWGRIIQGILSLTRSYPKEVVDLACKRGLAYGVDQYRVIKNICATGSYVLPVEFSI